MGTIKRLEIDGEPFAYLEHGDESQPLVLCVHGFPDVASTFEPLMTRLAAARFRCAAPWLRGYAPSTLRGPYTMDRIAEDLARIAERLSPERRVALVGHDWGAAALYFALAAHPERFCRAAALAVPHPYAFTTNAARTTGQLRRSSYMALFQLPFAERLLARDDFALVERLYRSWSPGFEPDVHALTEIKRCLAESLPAPLGYYRALVRSAPSYRRLLTSLTRSKISVPTLYLHGARDGCIAYGAARDQDRHFGAEFRSELLSGVGHFLHHEDPDRVASRLVDWFDSIRNL